MPARKRSAVLKESLEAYRTEILTLADVDEPTEEEATRSDELLGLFDETQEAYDTQVAHEERIEKVRSQAMDPRSRDGGPDVVTRGKRNPYERLEGVRSANLYDRNAVRDLRTRALYAIEGAAEFLTDAQQSRAERMIRSDKGGRLSQHMLLTGSDEYHRAFEELLTHNNPALLDAPEYEAYKTAEAHRRAMSLTDSAGGFLVPFTLDPTIILTNAGSANPFRRVATVRTIATDVWHGVSSSGVTAEWLAESSQVADASPTFGSPDIKPEKAAAWIQGSFEVLSDSGFASEVGPLLADAKDQLEAVAFATGDGIGKPEGVITGVAAVAGSRVLSKTIGAYEVGDVYALESALPPRYRLTGSPTWLADKAVINMTRQFDSAGGSSFWANLGMGQPEQLLGAPILEASAMNGAIAAGNDTLLLGDFRQYYIVDRVGMTMVYEPLVKGANGRPTGEAGWFAYWRVGAGVVNPDAFRLLRIRTSSTT